MQGLNMHIRLALYALDEAIYSRFEAENNTWMWIYAFATTVNVLHRHQFARLVRNLLKNCH